MLFRGMEERGDLSVGFKLGERSAARPSRSLLVLLSIPDPPVLIVRKQRCWAGAPHPPRGCTMRHLGRTPPKSIAIPPGARGGRLRRDRESPSVQTPPRTRLSSSHHSSGSHPRSALPRADIRPHPSGIGRRGVCVASRLKRHEGRCLGRVVLRDVATRRPPRVISRRRRHEGGPKGNSRPNGLHPAVQAGAPFEHGQVAPLCGLVLCLYRTGLQTRRRRAGSILHWNLEYRSRVGGDSGKTQRICPLGRLYPWNKWTGCVPERLSSWRPLLTRMTVLGGHDGP